MKKNQNILATLQKSQTSKAAIDELFSKISNKQSQITKRKSQIKNFTILRQAFSQRNLQNLEILKQTRNFQVMIA